MPRRTKSSSSRSFRSLLASWIPGLRRVRLLATTSLWLALGGGVAYGAWWGVPRLRAYAEERSHIDPSLVRVVFDRAPAWLPQECIDSLGQRARAALEGSPTLSASALDRVHVALADSGWLDHLEQVRRSAPDELVVVANFRPPFALVRSGEIDYVVDERGRRLPLQYEGSVRRPQLPLVLRVSMPKPAEEGGAWLGSDVRAALNLARLLRTRPWFTAGRVMAIDAGRFGTEGILELVTDEGTRIVWGSDPDARSLSEMPAERKLACLDALWRSSRRIDDGSGRTMDLRIDVVTVGSSEAGGENLASAHSGTPGAGRPAIR